jgi:predicted amidophosphoribosyltransferase
VTSLRAFAASMSRTPPKKRASRRLPSGRAVCESCGAGTLRNSSLCWRCSPHRKRRRTAQQRSKSARKAARARWDRKPPARGYVPRAELSPEELAAVRARDRANWRGQCSRCGSPMSRNSASASEQMCRACRKPAPSVFTCKVCSAEFTAYGRRVTCSRKCANELFAIRQKALGLYKPPRNRRPGTRKRWTGTTTERGLGYRHQKARREALAALKDGEACPRCGEPMSHDQLLAGPVEWWWRGICCALTHELQPESRRETSQRDKEAACHSLGPVPWNSP